MEVLKELLVCQAVGCRDTIEFSKHRGLTKEAASVSNYLRMVGDDVVASAIGVETARLAGQCPWQLVFPRSFDKACFIVFLYGSSFFHCLCKTGQLKEGNVNLTLPTKTLMVSLKIDKEKLAAATGRVKRQPFRPITASVNAQYGKRTPRRSTAKQL
jgi:hypothetical protein